MKIFCSAPLHDPDQEWVVLKEPITMGDWNKWRIADHQATQDLVREWVTEFHIRQIPLEAFAATFDELPLSLFDWLVEAITSSLLESRRVPEKN